ncbi:MAG: CinA family protein [Candidatus Omnitrophica bacterium]|nr:CinA family protein [Candidatus Omnitrophota bacterium]
MRLEAEVAQGLIDRFKTLAIAESCTGGLLTHRLTNIPGSSRFLQAALVLYNNEAKKKILKVPARVLGRYGAVSEQTAAAMAKAVRRMFRADFGVAITGIAGPGGATETKPVGLVYIAISVPAETLCLRCRFQGTRAHIKRQASTQALRLLKKCLS